MNDLEKYNRAKRKVKEIKGFYSHLRIFIFVNLIVFIGRYVLVYRFDILSNKDQGFIDWFNVNTYILPGLWVIGLIIHGLRVHGYLRPFKSWEERKINEYMEKDDNLSDTSYE